MRSGRSRSPHPIRRRARLGRGRSPLAPPVRRDRTPDLLSRPMPRNPPATLRAAHLSQRRKPQPAERRRAATPPSALPARRWLALRSATSGPLSRPVRTHRIRHRDGAGEDESYGDGAATRRRGRVTQIVRFRSSSRGGWGLSGWLLWSEAVAQRGSVRRALWNAGMPQNFLDCDREQAFLMPPSLLDWLPRDHLAWFVLQTVEQLDLAVFYAWYRPDGHGRAAYEPSMMACCCMPTRPTCIRRGGSSVTAARTSRIG